MLDWCSGFSKLVNINFLLSYLILNVQVKVLKGESLDVLDHASTKHSSIYQTSSLYLEPSKSESSDDEPMSDKEKCVKDVDKGNFLMFYCFFPLKAEQIFRIKLNIMVVSRGKGETLERQSR